MTIRCKVEPEEGQLLKLVNGETMTLPGKCTLVTGERQAFWLLEQYPDLFELVPETEGEAVKNGD